MSLNIFSSIPSEAPKSKSTSEASKIKNKDNVPDTETRGLKTSEQFCKEVKENLIQRKISYEGIITEEALYTLVKGVHANTKIIYKHKMLEVIQNIKKLIKEYEEEKDKKSSSITKTIMKKEDVINRNNSMKPSKKKHTYTHSKHTHI